MNIHTSRLQISKCTNSNEKISTRIIILYLAVSFLFLCLSSFLLGYIIIYIHLPNQEFINVDEKVCTIKAASLSCWRRNVMSAARVEEGRYKCWKFVVSGSNLTGVVQYSKTDDFPLSRNGCTSFASCGERSWSCRVSKSGAISLRWKYPTMKLIVCIISITGAIILCIMFTIRVYLAIRRNRERVSEQIPATIPYFSEKGSEFNDDVSFYSDEEV